MTILPLPWRTARPGAASFLTIFIPMYNGHRYQAIHLHGHSHFTDEADLEVDFADALNRQGVRNEIYNVGCMYWNYER